jgi:ABC-type multidrug transport system ATPase subunit
VTKLPLFELRGVEVAYGEAVALSVPELSIAAGERVALLGPNGSGKTTLLKALNGLVPLRSGSLLFLGEKCGASRSLRARSVYLHQHPYILAGTVSYNVGFACRSRRMRRPEAARRVGEALRALGLEGFERRRSRALSGGEAQRVALARAIAADADVLLLDEPTASADAASKDLVLDTLRGLSAAGATLVFSTHDDLAAGSLADRILVLERGRIVEDRRGGAR